MKKPDFFIVGAPKCGTTALCNYLSQHPGIFIPPIKEPHFFGPDLTGYKAVRTLEEYLSLFSAAGGRLSGEGSTWYLFSKTAAVEIHNFNPDARIIIMLRNPVDVLHSLHNQMLFDGRNEDIEDFAAAIQAEDDRRRGIRIPETCKRREAILYSDVVRFAEQTRRYLDVFGRDRVHIIIYDDFSSGTIASYRAAVRFLGLDDTFTPDIRIINASKRNRSRTLRNLYKNPPRTFKILAPKFIRASFLNGLKRYILELNTKYEKRKPMDPELRKKLQSQFASEIETLSSLIGRDLTHWSKD